VCGQSRRGHGWAGFDGGFYFGPVHVLWAVEVEVEVVFFDAAFKEGHFPLCAVEENEAVDVPGEEELCAGVGGFEIGIFDQRGIVRVHPLHRPGEFDFASQDEFAGTIVNAEVGPLLFDALGLFNFGAFEGESGVAGEKCVGPL
jgi:hypothetical protein